MKKQEVLNQFLQDNNAQSLNKIEAHNYTIEIYGANGKTFIVQQWTNGGFDIFIPAHDGNSIKETFEGVKRYLNGIRRTELTTIGELEAQGKI